MNANSIFAKIAVVLMALAVLIAFTPQPVMAGSNGQQVSVDICYASSFIVSGQNQNPYTQTTFKTVTANPSGCTQYDLKNWWWVGNISIAAYFADGTSETYWYYIPKQSQDYSDWVYIKIRRNSAVERGYKWVYLDPYYDGGTYLNVEQSTKNNLVTTTDSKKSGYYRMDCSGFVSYAWGIPDAPSPDTVSLYNKYSTINVGDLRAGDIVNDPNPGANGHVVLFVAWVDKSKYIFVAYEQFKWVEYNPDGSVKRVVDQGARVQKYQFTNVSGSHGNLSYYDNGHASSTGNHTWYAERY